MLKSIYVEFFNKCHIARLRAFLICTLMLSTIILFIPKNNKQRIMWKFMMLSYGKK